jgi:cation/acetate symporter
MIWFLVTTAFTLVITLWASRRARDRAAMYAASSSLTSTQNGLAIAGDFMSANTFLGMVALYAESGIDSAIYYCTPLVGFALMVRYLAGPLRRLGRYTLGDVIQTRFPLPRMRRLIGVSTIVISLIYLVAQLVGAGALISVLFGLSFNASVITIGGLMTTYVVFGGMLATTWLQIVKAGMLMCCMLAIGALLVVKTGGITQLYARLGSDEAAALFRLGGMHLGVFSAASLALGLTAGMLGLPHLLIRLFTVPDERTARRSIVVATGVLFICFALMFFVISPGAVAFVKHNAAFHDATGALLGGRNMFTVHLASAVGGKILFGLVAAVAFATILAVVAGLTVAIAIAFSHDVCAPSSPHHAIGERWDLVRFRLAAIGSSAVAVSLAVVFQSQNIAFLVAMAFAVAASATFPPLILTLYWKGLTAEGALASAFVGLLLSVALTVLGPACWVNTFGFSAPVFPSDYPSLIAVPAAFVTAWAVSRWRTPYSQAAHAIASAAPPNAPQTSTRRTTPLRSKER